MKKGRHEVNVRTLTEAQLAELKRAKFTEAHEWVSREVVKALPAEINGKSVSAMRLRWVITWKEENLKARLVVVGYQDDKLGERQVTSPTMQRRGRGLLTQVCANKGWTIYKGDVRKAFLQGTTLSKEKRKNLVLNDELAELLGVAPGSIG